MSSLYTLGYGSDGAWLCELGGDGEFKRTHIPYVTNDEMSRNALIPFICRAKLYFLLIDYTMRNFEIVRSSDCVSIFNVQTTKLMRNKYAHINLVGRIRTFNTYCQIFGDLLYVSMAGIIVCVNVIEETLVHIVKCESLTYPGFTVSHDAIFIRDSGKYTCKTTAIRMIQTEDMFDCKGEGIIVLCWNPADDYLYFMSHRRLYKVRVGHDSGKVVISEANAILLQTCSPDYIPDESQIISGDIIVTTENSSINITDIRTGDEYYISDGGDYESYLLIMCDR